MIDIEKYRDIVSSIQGMRRDDINWDEITYGLLEALDELECARGDLLQMEGLLSNAQMRATQKPKTVVSGDVTTQQRWHPLYPERA